MAQIINSRIELKRAVGRDSATGEVDGPRAEPARQEVLIESIGPRWLHRLAARLPQRWRYLLWHRMVRHLFNEGALNALATTAVVNMTQALRLGPSYPSFESLAASHRLELYNNLCLLLAAAPDMYRPRAPGLIRFEGLETFLQVARSRATVILGAHYSAFQPAYLALAAHRFPLHVVTLRAADGKPPAWSYFKDLGNIYMDPEHGNTIPVILVPDRMAAIKILRALRRRETVWAAVDIDVGISAREQTVPFLDRTLAVPQALYEVAQREGAAVFSMMVERHGDVGRPATHRFDVTIEPLGDAPSSEFQAFHQARAAQVEAHIKVHPEPWTIWRYWRT
ncbi:MAG: hypothetical protein ACK45V_01965 [Brevundimonas sp.]|jgi:lauroyl/myristoyl acyltransferase